MERVHVFLLNPAAGHSDQTHALSVQIGALCREKNLNYEILYSEYKGHIAKLVTDYALRHASMLCRFYACGGDGTLNEVVTGALDCDNAEVACYACGTGKAEVEVIVKDYYGNRFKDTITVESKYEFWQWLIRIFLLGFLWY